MSRNKLLALAVLVAAPAGLLAWTLLRSIETTRPAALDIPRQPANQVQRYTSPLPASSFAPAPNETTRSYIGRQMALAQDPVQSKQVLDAEIAELERRHHAEPVDAAWKTRAEGALAAIATSQDLKASGIAPTSYRNDCRSSTCRISAGFTSNGDAEDWGNMLTTMSGSTLRQVRTVVLDNPDGTFELRIYGVRK